MSSFNSVSDVVYTVQGATWCWLVSTWECTSVYKGMFLRVTSVSKVWVTGVYKMIYNCTSDRQKSIRWCTFQWRVSLWCTWDLQGPCTVLYVHVHCKVYAFLLHSKWCMLYCTVHCTHKSLSDRGLRVMQLFLTGHPHGDVQYLWVMSGFTSTLPLATRPIAVG